MRNLFEAFRRLAEMPRTPLLDVQVGGRRKEFPTGFEQAIPGTMVMFTLLVLLTSGTVGVVYERRTGVLRRLASTGGTISSTDECEPPGRLFPLLKTIRFPAPGSPFGIQCALCWAKRRWSAVVPER